MTSAENEQLEAIAARAARAGGDRVAGWSRADLRSDTKSSASDLVTAADREAEAQVSRVLADLRPDDGVLGEEGADQRGSSGLTWIVDPMDGTTNYVRDIPYWSTSVAVRRDADGAMLAGAVFAPDLGRLYRAGAGCGARLERSDGTSTTLRRESDPAPGTALLGTGLSYDASRRAAQLSALADLLPLFADIRRLGAAALDLCAVADGALDCFIESDLALHDYAAGALIATEAGATVSGRAAHEPPSPQLVLASVPSLYDTVRARATGL